MLKIENLTLYTKNNKDTLYLLNDICFSLNKGDCLGIIGKTGDGKSTLAKALLEIYDKNVYLEKGKIFFNNSLFSNDCRGKHISLVFQNPNSYLNPMMKVGKQIEEMLTFHFKQSKKVAKEKTLLMMKEVGIKNPDYTYSCYPHELSGGTQQRICLCIALICKPDVLILDECTSFLDLESKNEIINLILKFQKEYKLTLIVISHDFHEIYSLCNKIAIMRKGQIVEFGNIDEVLSNPNHSYTIELLFDYFRYYKDISHFTCPLLKIELIKAPPINQITNTHYVRNWHSDKRAQKINFPNNFDILKEQIYEHITNK